MKRCGHCGEVKADDEFFRDGAKLHSYCKVCKRAHARGDAGFERFQPYTRAELRYRPIEQVLEAMTCRDLGEALGICKSDAALLKATPWVYVDTELEFDGAKIRRIRKWLEG